MKSTFHAISPVAAIFLELVNESAVATLAVPKSILVLVTPVTLPLASNVKDNTLVLSPP